VTDRSYQEALDYLYSFIDQESMPQRDMVSLYDLRRVEEILGILGNPHTKTSKTIHIAGTKGKGSTAAMIASALRCAGYTVGLFTSPHLIDLTERIKIDDSLISQAELVTIVDSLKPHIKEINRVAQYGKLTTFELLTVINFVYFASKNVDIQVIETGMGGRLDATNVVRPDLCVITPISMDHTEILGSSLDTIAKEKAGIIKPGVPVVMAPQPIEIEQLITSICSTKDCKLIKVGHDIYWQAPKYECGRQEVEVVGRLTSYDVSVPLLGSFQLSNIATAIASLETLKEQGYSKINSTNIISGLYYVEWPGRFQIIRHHPLMILDGAHNPQSIRALLEALSGYLKLGKIQKPGTGKENVGKPSILIFGTSSDKDVVGMIFQFKEFDSVIVTRSRHPRAMDIDELGNRFMDLGICVEKIESVVDAVLRARELAGQTGLVLITGSLFVVGEVLESFERRRITR
jgi:dihydrofolate synthase/folylpolyglutamate synthase